MGQRTLKRVPLDFAWPLKTKWPGYVNPHYRECAACEGRGSSPGGRYLEELVVLLMLAGEDARKGTCHPRLSWFGPAPEQFAELTVGLSGQEPSIFGYDAVATYTAMQKIISAAGLPEKWSECPACEGEGTDPASRAAYEAWKETDPPAGEGWQLWETTSEGSPVSPVFATAEELAEWCAEGATTFANYRASAEEWLRMFREDSVYAGTTMMFYVPASA